MKRRITITIAQAGAAALLALLGGCAATTAPQYFQPAINFTNKLPLRVALYVGDSIRTLRVPVTPIGGCGGDSTSVAAGDDYIRALQHGLETACKDVQVLDKPPAPKPVETYDVLVTVALRAGNSSATVNTKEYNIPHLHCRYETTVYVKYADAAGDSLDAYTASVEGYDNMLGPCGAMADVLNAAIQNCMHELADYVANATYNSTQLNAVAKSWQ